MRDAESKPGACPEEGEGAPADGSRRLFVKRAALVGLPVVLATIPSRTVWAGPRYNPPADASAGGSVNPSGTTARVRSLL